MSDDKPSLDELTELQHHGVKGMRWGVRSKRSYPSGKEIRTARRNVQARRAQMTGNRIATGVRAVQGNKKAVASLKTQHKDMKMSFLKSPDRVTALKMTKGESAALAILAIHPALTAPVLGRIAVGEGVARTIQSRQSRGVYDKKK
jgi:Ni,Fe-hydrogenase III large subunit